MTQGSHDSVAADWLVFRDSTTNGRSAEALEFAERIIAEVDDDPRRVAQAMIEKLVALLNMGEVARLGPMVDEISDVLRSTPDPRLVGEFHAIAAMVAIEHGSLGSAMTNLVRAERVLRRMAEISLAAMDAWHDLAVAYTTCGFHAKALEAHREATLMCAAAGVSPALALLIETEVRAAVYLDQRGDTRGCIRGLQAVVASARALVAEVPISERVFLRYAVERLAAFGQPVALSVPVDPAGDQVVADVNRLTEVCMALAADDAGLALTLLDRVPRAIDILGAAEPVRLRSLALSASGDAAGALTAERETLRITVAEDGQLRELLADSISARLDQDRLRRVAMQYAGEAYTDPLTGLPNRRRTAEVAAGLARLGASAMLGVLDLDGFKAVNDTHGHPSGDLVLQRVAGIFARAVRQGDLLARHGGDEFIMILPETTQRGAEEIGQRIRTAIGEEDWSALVPGTPVSVSIGWAPLADDLDAALKKADDALYRNKRIH